MKRQEQSKSLKYTIKQISIFFLIILVLTGCEHQINGYVTAPRLQDKLITDSLRITLEYYYIAYPDSAIYLSEQLLLQMRENIATEDQLFLFSFLAELYQYRKENDLLALENMTQAIRVLSEHQELPFDNPYLFVNIGNILLRYGLYEHALRTYKEALQITVLPDNPHTKVLINNNIALTYVELDQFDSARSYFQQAANHIVDKSNLTQAQNDAYLTTLYAANGRMDSVSFYYQKAVSVLNQYQYNSLYHQPQNHDKAEVLYHEIRSQIDKAKSAFFETTMQHDSSLQYLQTSLYHSKMAGTYLAQADIYFKMAQIVMKTKNNGKVKLYADSAMMFARQIGDYNRVMDYSRFLKGYYEQQHNNLQKKGYQQLINTCEDTLMKRKSSKELLIRKINMATGSMDLILRNMDIVQQKHIKTISQQKTIIRISVLLLVVISFFLFIYIVMYFKLRRTQQRLAHRTSEFIQQENRRVNKQAHVAINTAQDNLLQRFETTMEVEKPYLDNNLNLSILATKLQTNQTYLSQLINQHYNVNFNEYINNKRIVEACRLFLKLHETNMTIDHVIDQVGFRSKSTFYNAFRKYSGVSPAMFIKMQNQQATPLYKK